MAEAGPSAPPVAEDIVGGQMSVPPDKEMAEKQAQEEADRKDAERARRGDYRPSASEYRR